MYWMYVKWLVEASSRKKTRRTTSCMVNPALSALSKKRDAIPHRPTSRQAGGNPMRVCAVLTQNLDWGSKRQGCFEKNFAFHRKNRRPKRRGLSKEDMRHQKKIRNAHLLFFFENGQTINQETHNHKVNENLKTKHDLLIMRFWVRDVCSKCRSCPCLFGIDPSHNFG